MITIQAGRYAGQRGEIVARDTRRQLVSVKLTDGRAVLVHECNVPAAAPLPLPVTAGDVLAARDALAERAARRPTRLAAYLAGMQS